MSFILANPFLEGGSDITSNEQSRKNAAKDIWMKFSQNIKNCTPNFYFSIKNTESGAFSHYKVSEQISKNNKVGMKLKRLEKKKINSNALDLFENNNLGVDSDNESLSDMSSTGGGDKYKKYDLNDNDDSDSSDSDSDSDTRIKSRRKSKGIKLMYAPGIYNVANIGMPIITSNFASVVSLVGLGSGVGVGKAVADLGNGGHVIW